MFPSGAESNMSKTDGAPREQCSQTGEGLKPLENDITACRQVEVGQEAEGNDETDRWERSSSAIDVREDLEAVSLLADSSDGS